MALGAHGLNRRRAHARVGAGQIELVVSNQSDAAQTVTFETDELVLEALRAGASGFLGKGTDPESLIAAIRTVAAGEQLLSPAATRSLIERVLATPQAARVQHPGIAELTEREREIVVQVARGLSNDEIGRELFISPATAKTHINRAMMKTRARDRAQLVVFAYESGLVQPKNSA